jgi:signal recognition particle GTPase
VDGFSSINRIINKQTTNTQIESLLVLDATHRAERFAPGAGIAEAARRLSGVDIN